MPPQSLLGAARSRCQKLGELGNAFDVEVVPKLPHDFRCQHCLSRTTLRKDNTRLDNRKERTEASRDLVPNYGTNR